MATLILNASEILTMAGPDGPRAGRDKGTLGLLRDGAVLLDKGLIVAAGPKAVVLTNPLAKGAKILSAEGRVLMPGFVDAHTHPVFAAPRLEDFEARIAGKSYAEIAQRGGGILACARAVDHRHDGILAVAQHADRRLRALAVKAALGQNRNAPHNAVPSEICPANSCHRHRQARPVDQTWQRAASGQAAPGRRAPLQRSRYNSPPCQRNRAIRAAFAMRTAHTVQKALSAR